jgi:hypothetical protein
MHAAIITVWTIGLVGALIPTVVVLKLGLLVIAVLRDILKLAAFTAAAADGIAVNVAPIASIPDLAPAGEGLTGAAREVCRVLHSIEQHVGRTQGD